MTVKVNNTNNEQVWITMVSGTIAGTTATVSKQPLARIKWLKQTSEYHTKIEHTRIHNIARHIAKNEGIAGLWRGTSAAIFRNIPQSMLLYTFFPIFHRHVSRLTERQSYAVFKRSAVINTITGSLSSMAGTLITHPADTLRVRIAVQYELIEYGSIYSTTRFMLRKEGLSAFYFGLPMTILGTIVRGGVGFGLYETIKSQEMREWTSEHSLLKRLLAGYVSAAVSTTVSYPMDTIRRRQQVFGSARTVDQMKTLIGGEFQRHYKAKDAIMFILETEGPRGFFKGLGLGLVKTPIASAISLTINDLVKRLLGWNA